MNGVSDINSLTKIKVNSLKRKAPSSVESKHKQKKFKSDDTCSILSLTTSEAYGIRAVTDDFDLDDYQLPTDKPVEASIQIYIVSLSFLIIALIRICK